MPVRQRSPGECVPPELGEGLRPVCSGDTFPGAGTRAAAQPDELAPGRRPTASSPGADADGRLNPVPRENGRARSAAMVLCAPQPAVDECQRLLLKCDEGEKHRQLKRGWKIFGSFL